MERFKGCPYCHIKGICEPLSSDPNKPGFAMCEREHGEITIDEAKKGPDFCFAHYTMPGEVAFKMPHIEISGGE